MARCEATNMSGERCGANATSNGKCAIHQHKNKARELARKGVERRRKEGEEARAKAAAIVADSSEDLNKALAVVLTELLIGNIDAATARAAACVANTMLKAREVIQAEKRLNPASQFEGQTDPADLSLEEWEAKYHPQFMAIHEDEKVTRQVLG
jgi:hypothetical protein